MSEFGIPFFGVAREFAAHRDEMLARCEAVLGSGNVLQGPSVRGLEERVAARAGRKHAIAVGSCTDALYYSLKAAGVGAGDSVLVTDFSFVASASCIARVGAVPVFVDVDENYNLDLDAAAERVLPNTRSMVYVHLYGQMGNPDRVEVFAREHKLVLIEDAAQAFGANFAGRPAGSMGLVSCFSFDPTKVISAPGSGGMVLTDDVAVAARIRALRYHGKTNEGIFAELGYNSQMPSLTAAILDLKLDHDAEWRAKRRDVAQFYIEQLAGTDLVLPQEQRVSTHIYHKFVLRSQRREALKTHLAEKGIPTRVHYPQPLHRQPCFSGAQAVAAHSPNAERFSQSVLSLPIHPFLSDGEVEAVAKAIRQYIRRQAN